MFLIWALVAATLIVLQIVGVIALPVWALVTIVLAPFVVWLVLILGALGIAAFVVSK